MSGSFPWCILLCELNHFLFRFENLRIIENRLATCISSHLLLVTVVCLANAMTS